MRRRIRARPRRVSSPAEIVLDRRGGHVVARLSGEVDMSNASYVRDQLLASMPNDALALVLDISGCRYLDSAAIEVLFASRRLGGGAGAPARHAVRLAAAARDRADGGPHGSPVFGSLEEAHRVGSALAREGRSHMAHESPKRIRNVALVGHRGSGKTSVNEALLFEAGAINRLGSVADGRRSRTRRPTRSRARCRSRRASRRFAGTTARST